MQMPLRILLILKMTGGPDDWSIDDEDEDFEDEYESDGDSTVIDDPDAMGDQISDDTSDDEKYDG